jgi:hypothetical protein
MAPDWTETSALGSRVRVPSHVVYRHFGDDTVILNLDSGVYHGLNRTAAVMIERLGQSDCVRTAVDSLSAEFGQPREVIERDVLDLCRALSERGLIVRDDGDGR